APVVYHRGAFLPEPDARVPLQDRGLLFADGVYEVVRFDHGRPFAMGDHVRRFRQSLAAIDLPADLADPFPDLSHELLRRNRLTDAKIYWQVTRGPAARDFRAPDDPSPSLTLLAYPTEPLNPDPPPLAHGPALVVDDCRWTQCRVKSLMLLPASLAKTRARRAGAVEAVFARAKPAPPPDLDPDSPPTPDASSPTPPDAPPPSAPPGRHITEGASTNIFIIQHGRLRTHPDDGWVLPGITRQTLLDLAHGLGLPTDDRTPFTPHDLLHADEAFACSTTQLTALTSVMFEPIPPAISRYPAPPARETPLTTHPIADARRPGPLTHKLHTAYHQALLAGPA
ncbi:MAG: aminotransferase class IV, partial [Planctomycetota bacterium]